MVHHRLSLHRGGPGDPRGALFPGERESTHDAGLSAGSGSVLRCGTHHGFGCSVQTERRHRFSDAMRAFLRLVLRPEGQRKPNAESTVFLRDPDRTILEILQKFLKRRPMTNSTWYELKGWLRDSRIAAGLWLGKPCVFAAWLGLSLAILTPPHGTGFSVCWFKHCTGLPCLGCGLTRSLSCA